MSGVILYADAHLFPPEEADFELAAAHGYRLVPVSSHEPAELGARSDGAEALLAYGGPYGTEVFDALPALKVLARCGVGYDNIDRAAARARGIAITYVPGASNDEVAEHTLALLLDAARNITFADRCVRAASWPSAAELGGLRRLRGRALGLIGFGRIGQAVAWRARGLGLRVCAHDPYQTSSVFTEHGVTQVPTLDELLRASDIISLHAPGTRDHAHILGSAQFTQMKPQAILINTARGSLVDTTALDEALGRGQLFAAALDVIDPEPLPADHPIRGHANLILTPHAAAFSTEALTEIRRQALTDALAVLGGLPPAHPIPTEEQP